MFIGGRTRNARYAFRGLKTSIFKEKGCFFKLTERVKGYVFDPFDIDKKTHIIISFEEQKNPSPVFFFRDALISRHHRFSHRPRGPLRHIAVHMREQKTRKKGCFWGEERVTRLGGQI